MLHLWQLVTTKLGFQNQDFDVVDVADAILINPRSAIQRQLNASRQLIGAGRLVQNDVLMVLVL